MLRRDGTRRFVQTVQALRMFFLKTGTQLCDRILGLGQRNAAGTAKCNKKDRCAFHCDACVARGWRSSHACAAETRARPGTVAARLMDFHFGSKPGACNLSIREKRWSTKRATRSERFELAIQLNATRAVGTAIVETRSPCLMRLG